MTNAAYRAWEKYMGDIVQWRVCPSFPDYDVSEYGDVRRNKPDKRNHKFGHLLNGKVQQNRKRYNLCRDADNKRYDILAHRLVAEAFLGPKPFEGAEVCHNDGNSLHNHYSNLRWDTHKSNHLDRIQHGTSNRGVKNPRAKLTPEQVLEIRSLYTKGYLQLEIADDFGLAQATISVIVNKVNWGYLQ